MTATKIVDLLIDYTRSKLTPAYRAEASRLERCNLCHSMAHIARDCELFNPNSLNCATCDSAVHLLKDCLLFPSTIQRYWAVQQKRKALQAELSEHNQGDNTLLQKMTSPMTTPVTLSCTCIGAHCHITPAAKSSFSLAMHRSWSTQELHSVQILLDTGSELSFINSSFADELHLPFVGQRSLNIHTFGSMESSHQICDLVTAQVLDTAGQIYDFTLLKHDVLTATLPQAQLSDADWKYIFEKNIVLSRDDTGSHMRPQILLGCDYLWSLLNMGEQQLTLPSGLLLIPSPIGHIVTGSQLATTCIAAQTLTSVNILTFQQEVDQWDTFWSMESTGVNEFSGTRNEEKTRINQQVLEYFNKTVQLRDDGHHVRLPWKEDHDPLPDNRSIAHRRLESILRSYMHSPDIMEQYDRTFKEKLEKGIPEIVDETRPVEGIVHYLAHQAVITPHKETTKLRVVFDASAHYKNSPCLNDILHQGPLIMPEMMGMLLRFRLANIAMISDVEKAFLQVRLQEIDRDATRCLWLKDVSKPITQENLVVFRFTRVTFGLNSSPLLLAATIEYHLEHIEDRELRQYAPEIRRNLYVDNLLMGANNTEDAIAKYHASKLIFSDMNMNLREFLTSSSEVNKFLDVKDRATNTSPKVLGITWDSKEDTFVLHCNAPSSHPHVTKRIVSQQVAAIYDPLGWRVPLLLPAKLFLQALWLKKFDWDDILPMELERQWNTIINGIRQFTISLPRRVHDTDVEHSLVALNTARHGNVHLFGP